MTAFQALYAREPPTIVRYVMSSSAFELVELYMLQRNAVMDLLKHNLIKAHQRMREFANKRQHHIEFKVGERAFVKLNTYRQQSMRLQPYHKFGRCYFGLFKVLKRIEDVAYELDLPNEA